METNETNKRRYGKTHLKNNNNNIFLNEQK
jgi:hypothetical protein